uniref:Helicase n=1 Tax=viral metagenome TaxID=1070528 RepID=A0A6C0APU9_9ZZZZ
MASEIVEDDVIEYSTFEDMELSADLLRGIYGYGFTKPSKIQGKGIKPIVDGKDLLAQAQSGTGKTGTFCIGSLYHVDPTKRAIQVLCLVPTRELAQQIEHVASSLGNYMGVKTYAAMGKTPVREDIRSIEKGVQFLVGTPGRIYDLMSRRAFSTEHIKVIIVDEADQMLEDRFKQQLQCILDLGFPATARCAFFSATMNAEVVEFVDKLLNNPVRILIPPEEVTLKGIQQYAIGLDREDWKFEVLLDLYKNLDITQALIYCNTRKRVEWLADKMIQSGYPISFIHGEMDVKERMGRMAAFRKGETRVLISTDLLARGIDVQQVSLVINYELPPDDSKDNYIHRIGRSGRYGRKGTSINLMYGDEIRLMDEMKRKYEIDLLGLPEDLSQIKLV